MKLIEWLLTIKLYVLGSGAFLHYNKGYALLLMIIYTSFLIVSFKRRRVFLELLEQKPKYNYIIIMLNLILGTVLIWVFEPICWLIYIEMLIVSIYCFRSNSKLKKSLETSKKEYDYNLAKKGSTCEGLTFASLLVLIAVPFLMINLLLSIVYMIASTVG